MDLKATIEKLNEEIAELELTIRTSKEALKVLSKKRKEYLKLEEKAKALEQAPFAKSNVNS